MLYSTNGTETIAVKVYNSVYIIHKPVQVIELQYFGIK